MRAPLSSSTGFTFVEILAALAFLGLLLPAVIGALTLSNRASLLAERSAVATQLAENQLNSLLLDGTWNTGTPRGDFGTDWNGYRWEMAKRTWPTDTMSELTLTVFFTVQGQERSVSLTTLASDTTLTTQ